MRRLVKARRLALDPNPRWLACAAGVLVLGAACSSALKAPKAPEEDADAKHLRSGKVTFRNPEMAAMYAAAKANPNAFDPVYVYAKSVTDACLASLVDKRCETCAEGAVRYKRRSELDPQHWAIIEDALSMLENLGNVPGLPAEQMDLLVATKGRLLWLAGRSVEEQTLIDEYARAHPTAVAVVRRRLELLREAGDGAALESQCARSRAKTQSAPEAARVDLLTACVALHPNNSEGRSDMLDYATYLPNLSPAEDNALPDEPGAALSAEGRRRGYALCAGLRLREQGFGQAANRKVQARLWRLPQRDGAEDACVQATRRAASSTCSRSGSRHPIKGYFAAESHSERPQDRSSVDPAEDRS